MKFRHLLLSITGEEVVSVDEETTESVVSLLRLLYHPQVEAKLIIGDDTAVNGVELTCTSPHSASLVGTVK